MSMLLKQVNFPKDIKNMSEKELKQLAKEIRYFLIKSVSKTGGHLASNLGVVELTIALHYCFDLPNDKIVWDVGHQAYVHKLLTGRKKDFCKLRQLNGLSGFPKPHESEYDVFAAGHSSTSISAALGIAKARDLKGEYHHVIAVIGDGAMTGGLAYEALNNAAKENTNLIVILNDNEMSISSNVGAMSRYLTHLRTDSAYIQAKENFQNFSQKIPFIGNAANFIFEKMRFGAKFLFLPGMLFEEMGFHYIGPVDGHNLEDLKEVFQNVKQMRGPLLIHIKTKKGKGYTYAEQESWKYHGVGKFDIKTGQPLCCSDKEDYSAVFGKKLIELAEKNKNILALTAAMASGTGLLAFQKRFPERFFDVAIAEQHGVTFSAGLACQGMVPVFAVYSTFLQRAYDQIVHDVCMQKLPVVFAIDRAGIVGADGETHQGVFDIAYLSHIPNMTLLSPKNKWELEDMLAYAVEFKNPIAIRYPRGIASEQFQQYRQKIVYGESEVIQKGHRVALLAEGHMLTYAAEAAKLLKQKNNITAYIVNMRFLKPLDEQMLKEITKYCENIVTIENGLIQGGFGSKVLEYYNENDMNNIKVIRLGFPDKFVEQGTTEELYQLYGLNGQGIYNSIIQKGFIND